MLTPVKQMASREHQHVSDKTCICADSLSLQITKHLSRNTKILHLEKNVNRYVLARMPCQLKLHMAIDMNVRSGKTQVAICLVKCSHKIFTNANCVFQTMMDDRKQLTELPACVSYALGCRADTGKCSSPPHKNIFHIISIPELAFL